MANDIWKGVVGNWDVTANWSSGAPTGDDEIDSGDAQITNSQVGKSLLLNPAGRLTLENGGQNSPPPISSITATYLSTPNMGRADRP